MTDGNTWDGIEDLGNVKRGMPDLTVDDVFRAMDALSERGPESARKRMAYNAAVEDAFWRARGAGKVRQ